MEKNELEMSAGEAWLDFYRYVYPDIKAGLEWHERNRIITAHRDFMGRRKKSDGKPQRLGADRIASILTTYAPDRYRVEMRAVFWKQAAAEE